MTQHQLARKSPSLAEKPKICSKPDTHGSGVCRSRLESDSCPSSSLATQIASSSPLSRAALVTNGVLTLVGTGGTSAPLPLFELSFRFRVELESREREGVERFRGRGVADIICVISGDMARSLVVTSSDVDDTCMEYTEDLLCLRGVWT